jgi:hypothetical protein
MILDAVETVLGPCGFDRTVHSSSNGNFNKRNKARRNKWYKELREERMKDIRTEIS